MKKLNIIPLFLFTLLLFAACEDDNDSNPTYKDPTTFVLNAPAYASTVYDLKYSTTLELTCSQPDYAYTTATTYTVQVSLNDDFATEGKFMTLETKYTTARMNVNAQEISSALTELWSNQSAESFPTTPIEVYFRLKAALTSNGKGAIYSNSVKLSQVIGNPEAPITLDHLYVVGSFCGWDWKKAFVAPPVNSKAGMFWAVMYFAKDDEFKINVSAADDANVEGYNASLFSQETIDYAGLSDNGGNIKVGKAGWYLIVVNSELKGRTVTYKSIDFLAPNVYITGDISGGWDVFDDARLFTVPADGEGFFVSPAFKAGGDLRMCVKLTDIDWWKSEFVILGGKIAYRGNGGDQERLPVAAGQKAYLNFMTGSGEVK